MKVDGIGEGTAVFLNLFSQIRRKCELDELKNIEQISSSQDAGEYCKRLFSGRIYECIFMVSLNSKNKVINYEKLSEGTPGEVGVSSRKVVSFALQSNANKIIIAHNHPGGTLFPSDNDINITRNLKDALNMVDIEMVDHIIVSGEKYASFKDLGLL